jgi:hypothetical protein
MTLRVGKISVKATTNFNKKLAERARQTINNRIYKAKEEVYIVVKDIIIKAIEGSRVYKGLNGEFPNLERHDLQAEFGLTDQMAKTALNRMMEILIETIDVEVGRIQSASGLSSDVNITISALDPAKYEDQLKSGDEFHYYSTSKSTIRRKRKREPKVYHIEWMKWLLEAKMSAIKADIPDIKDYGIRYDLSGVPQGISRSGRAVMSKALNKIRRFPYQFPVIAIPNPGTKNFIDEIAKSRELKALIRSKVRSMMIRILKSR